MKYMLVCDLDDTLTGNREAIEKFNEVVAASKFYLVYSSGPSSCSLLYH